MRPGCRARPVGGGRPGQDRGRMHVTSDHCSLSPSLSLSRAEGLGQESLISSGHDYDKPAKWPVVSYRALDCIYTGKQIQSGTCVCLRVTFIQTRYQPRYLSSGAPRSLRHSLGPASVKRLLARRKSI